MRSCPPPPGCKTHIDAGVVGSVLQATPGGRCAVLPALHLAASLGTGARPALGGLLHPCYEPHSRPHSYACCCPARTSTDSPRSSTTAAVGAAGGLDGSSVPFPAHPPQGGHSPTPSSTLAGSAPAALHHYDARSSRGGSPGAAGAGAATASPPPGGLAAPRLQQLLQSVAGAAAAQAGGPASAGAAGSSIGSRHAAEEGAGAALGEGEHEMHDVAPQSSESLGHSMEEDGGRVDDEEDNLMVVSIRTTEISREQIFAAPA
jgi:hypothetical protein